MSSKPNRRPVSTRFRRAAAVVLEDIADHVGDVTWVVGSTEDDELVVLCTARGDGVDGVDVEHGDRVRPDPDNDLVVVLELPDGTAFGALCGLGMGTGPRRDRALGRARRLGEVLAAVAGAEWETGTETARAEAEASRAREVEVEALTDALTGLANRRSWDRALEAEERRRRRYGGTSAVIVVDLDELKEINDTQGHLHGDLLLRLVARVITDSSRESDLIARTGGDEFAVLALNCEEPQLRVLVSRLRKALQNEGVAASVGAACATPGSEIGEAWAEADEVMLAEKQRRKGV